MDFSHSSQADESPSDHSFYSDSHNCERRLSSETKEIIRRLIDRQAFMKAAEQKFLSPGAAVALEALTTDADAGNNEQTLELDSADVRDAVNYRLTITDLSVRGARGCLDQRERLLAKRDSLRQGRLYFHLTGGRVNIKDMERPFTWNSQQRSR